MDTRAYMYLLVLCVWCLLNAGGLLMVVTAHPAVNAWIVTPEADRKEGGQVEMRCVATNLEANHIVAWRTDEETLRWGESTLTTNQRFEYETTHPGTGKTTQVFTITDLQRDDTDEYICNVNDPIPTGGHNIVATSSVMLSVLYFPSESFPICSPDGRITVDIGTELYMQCSSEAGNSAVIKDVNENTSRCNTYKWTTSNVNDTVMTSLNLTVDMADDNVTFECVISSMYYPDMTRSCIIGPISVNGVTEPIMNCTTESTTVINTTQGDMTAGTMTTSQTDPVTEPLQTSIMLASDITVIAGASAGGVLALVITIIIILICRRRCLCCHLKPKPELSNIDLNSNPCDQVEHSQPNIYAGTGLFDHKDNPEQSTFQPQNNPQNNPHTIYQEVDEVPVIPNIHPEPGASQSNATPETRKVNENLEPQYAIPHKVNTTPRNDQDERLLHSVQGHVSTQDGYDHIVLNTIKNKDQARKPTARVTPTVHMKPKMKPKPYRPVSTDAENNQVSSSPQSLSIPPSTSNIEPLNGSRRGRMEVRPPSHIEATYPQVSVPDNQIQQSDEHVVYADLDLTSNSSDGNDQALVPIYASVKKTK